MIRFCVYIVCFLFFICHSVDAQNEKLRIEIIDVFKEYDPEISNSIKISSYPIFDDTLQTRILIDSPVLNKNLELKEVLKLRQPNKFNLNNIPSFSKRHVSFDIGSNSIFNPKIHYTNGISVQHNSGFLIEHNSERYLINRHHDGFMSNVLSLYSSRFIKNMFLKTSIDINSKTGFYWGDLKNISLDSVGKYNGKNITLNLDFIQFSNHALFHNLNLDINYFINNYGRKEFTLNSLLTLELEKALKKYSFDFDVQFVNTVFDNAPTLDFISNYSNFSFIQSSSDFSDLLLTSKLLISGSKKLNYDIGLNFQYFPNDDVQYGGVPLVFPKVNLFKKLGKSHHIELDVGKKIIYQSFSNVFNIIPYLDPDYRNSLIKKFNLSFLYNAKVHNNISVYHNLHYIIERGTLIPFLFDRGNGTMSLVDSYMNSLSLYKDDIQQGIVFSSSISISAQVYDFFVEGSWQIINSSIHTSHQFVPRFQLKSTFKMDVTNRINMVSNISFIGKKDALQIAQLNEQNYTYVQLNSYLDINLLLNYRLDSVIFSLEFKNILNQKRDFFDGYYDSNGFKASIGFMYKF